MSTQTPIGTPPVGNPLSPQPKRRRLKVWHWALIGVGAVVVLGIVASALGGGGASTTTTSQQKSSAAQSASTTVKHYVIGDQVSVGDTWVVTLNSATLNAGSATFAPKAGNTFLVVDGTLKNVSSQEQNVSSILMFTVKDATGQKYTESLMGVASVQANTLDGKVEAGGLLRGQVVFEVPSTQRQFTFAFQPTLTSSQTIWDITNPQSGSTSVEQQPTVAPQPTAASPAQPKVVLQVSGNGNKTTDSFTVSGKWQIAYTVQPATYVVFDAFVYPEGESTLYADVINASKAGSDTSIEHQGGTYYLKVISGVPWSITVTDLPD